MNLTVGMPVKKIRMMQDDDPYERMRTILDEFDIRETDYTPVFSSIKDGFEVLYSPLEQELLIICKQFPNEELAGREEQTLNLF